MLVSLQTVQFVFRANQACYALALILSFSRYESTKSKSSKNRNDFSPPILGLYLPPQTYSIRVENQVDWVIEGDIMQGFGDECHSTNASTLKSC